MLAYEVARGLVSFTTGGLRKYSPEDLNVLLNALTLVQREIRAETVPVDDTLLIREKNQKLQRLSQAVGMLNTHIRQRRLHA